VRQSLTLGSSTVRIAQIKPRWYIWTHQNQYVLLPTKYFSLLSKLVEAKTHFVAADAWLSHSPHPLKDAAIFKIEWLFQHALTLKLLSTLMRGNMVNEPRPSSNNLISKTNKTMKCYWTVFAWLPQCASISAPRLQHMVWRMHCHNGNLCLTQDSAINQPTNQSAVSCQSNLLQIFTNNISIPKASNRQISYRLHILASRNIVNQQITYDIWQ
jgi:hypothetical protein